MADSSPSEPVEGLDAERSRLMAEQERLLRAGVPIEELAKLDDLRDLAARGHTPGMDALFPPSPSEPVESREQPRGGPPRNRSQNSPTKETITGNVIETTSTQCLDRGCTPPLHFVGCDKAAWPPRQERQLRADLAAALASIRNLETLRDVHRRTIDDLISEAQTAGATIDELRAEVERRLKPWQDRDIYATMTRAEPAMRDELLTAWAARDDALAEVSRLREQVEAVRAVAFDPSIEWRETVVRIQAILEPAREGE